MLSAEPVAIFTRSWSLYDLITERNYMFHREIYAGVGELLRLRADRGEYRLLDLGCGNARYLAPCLKRSPPLIYEGVDLSEAALKEAREYLAGLPGETSLTEGELLQTIESMNQTWDVIFSGFAIHHLWMWCVKKMRRGRIFWTVISISCGKSGRACRRSSWKKHARTFAIMIILNAFPPCEEWPGKRGFVLPS